MKNPESWKFLAICFTALTAILLAHFRQRTNAYQKEQLKRYANIQNIFYSHNGGIYKRIDETRELVIFLHEKYPDLVKNNPWVFDSWLRSNDEFLDELSKCIDPSKQSSLFPRSDRFPRPRYEDDPYYNKQETTDLVAGRSY